MVVAIQPQQPIAELDPDWYAEAEANRLRANASDQALKLAVEELQGKVPVQKIKSGATTYSPDANGLITLPSGIVLPATTTTERDAVSSPTVGQAIYNTTNARPELYTPTGWKPFAAPPQVDVFTASGTWTKPQGARAVLAWVCAAGGAGGATFSTTGSTWAFGGGGGGVAEKWLPADALPASGTVTVGAPGLATASPSNSSPGLDGTSGGYSAFLDGTAQRVVASGGLFGRQASSSLPDSSMGVGGIPHSPTMLRQSRYNSNSINGITGAFHLAPGRGGDTSLFTAQLGNNYSTSNSERGAGGGALASTTAAEHATAPQGLTGALTYGVTPRSPLPNVDDNSTQKPAAQASRSGSLMPGDGGISVRTTRTNWSGTLAGGDGQVPGGGGGGWVALSSPSNGLTYKGGDGARGEVIVITLF